MEPKIEFYELGNEALAIGDLEKAKYYYEKSIDSDPSYFEGWQALAMTYYKLGQYDEAVNANKKAIELRPHDPMVWTSLSLAYIRQGNKIEAEKASLRARILSWQKKS
ncbi:tetratricopeptide repeat protein [Methylacidiphilum caldifontis]|uniref:Uncharacterized protein n=1 Tax=Methylacidiphilum caldifontis TaxID=2795386 RepID=A0A4Y8PCJ3_9BACT|nr:tetratricopeptide repeat protein [Methylacidiphilum caldifontis]QSR87851.1 tetratricopeptide repeat protein [Methylacidiphilum caldifontis]TFE68960.1 hypothetical protein A7Q10_07685 [Methylacidiphilum caldifontis]